ncbi:MAG TPA: hypothetical protein VJB87_02070 [Candidatus Nanoarchaeia archaeon]|nr:hypothetical protein [Candidatus Nanoarchaeia archaeon]
MAKFPEAIARLFKGVFVCKRCKKKVRTNSQRILNKEVLCRGCGGKAFRAIKKEAKK